jgi:hypothetical protein
MTGTIKILSSLLLVVILSGCMKTVCRTDTDCHKKLDWNNKGFTLVRTIVTNGVNMGN